MVAGHEAGRSTGGAVRYEDGVCPWRSCECFYVWNAYDRPVSLRNLGCCPPVATHASCLAAFLFRFAKPIAHFEFEGEVCAYVLFVDAHRQVSEETIIRCNHACAHIDTHIHIHKNMHTCTHAHTGAQTYRTHTHTFTNPQKYIGPVCVYFVPTALCLHTTPSQEKTDMKIYRMSDSQWFQTVLFGD